MADLKISQLTAISVLTPATDVLPVVDVGGVTKKITTNQILGSGGVATLASATITGAATVGTTLGVTGASTLASASVTGALGAAGLNVTGATIPANGVYLGSANSLSFSAASTLGMTLNSTGLAIGDTAFSGTRLTLRETATNPNALAMTNRNATQTWRIGVDVSAVDDKILGFYDSTSTTFRMQLTDTGNVGIGVTPSVISNVIRLEIGGALSTNLTLRSSSGNASARNWMVGSNVNAFGDFVIRQGNSQGAEPNSGTDRLVIDLNGNPIFTPSSTPATLSANGQLTVNATSNTNLRFSYRGSDGVTRVANLTLA